MGLPITSGLDPAARSAVELALQAVHHRIRCPPEWSAKHPIGALLLASAVGCVRAVIKSALVLGAAVGTAVRAREPRALVAAGRTVPRVVVSLLSALVLLGLGKLVAAVQTALGLESEGRPLSSDEQALLRFVFHDGLELEGLRVKPGPCGVAGLTDRPFVHGEVLYLKHWTLTDALLVHEAVHWWQHQHGGADYMFDSLWSQSFGFGYDFARSLPETPWEDLETEQQAALIEAGFRQGFFSSGRFEVQGRDLSSFLREGIRAVRTGRGAP